MRLQASKKKAFNLKILDADVIGYFDTSDRAKRISYTVALSYGNTLSYLGNKESINFMSEIEIEKMSAGSWPDVARIYQSGIVTGNATLQTEVPDWHSWDIAHRKDCRLIAIIDNKIIGWAALSNVSNRKVYAGVAEVSVYVDSDHRGKGVGDRLMAALITESESKGIWTLQAGIFPENVSSIRLHHKHGFRTVGIRARIGKLNDQWRDVALLERRSKVVGID